MTRDCPAIIVPLMISNLIAFFISYRLQHEPIYEAALASQDECICRRQRLGRNFCDCGSATR